MPTKEQYAANKEKYQAKYRAWFDSDKEKHKKRGNERSNRWKSEHREKCRAESKKYKSAHPEKVREYRIREYKISVSKYKTMIDEQGGKCKVCGSSKKLCIDHDHKTGNVRGLLCTRCNITLGLVNDSKELLISLIDYLE